VGERTKSDDKKNAVGEPTGRAPGRGAARPIDCVKLTEFQYCNSSEKTS